MNEFSYSGIEKSNYNYLKVFQNNSYWLYLMLIFFIPLLVGHLKTMPTQIFVGSAVNFFLALAAFRMQGKKIIPLILLPAIAAYLTGLVFGPSTVFLLYLIPFIWIGNASYVFGIKFLKRRLNRFSSSAAMLLSSGLKSAFLFTSAFALVYFSVIPEMFLLPMGLLQLVTAVIGGSFALAFNSKLPSF